MALQALANGRARDTAQIGSDDCHNIGVSRSPYRDARSQDWEGSHATAPGSGRSIRRRNQ